MKHEDTDVKFDDKFRQRGYEVALGRAKLLASLNRGKCYSVVCVDGIFRVVTDEEMKLIGGDVHVYASSMYKRRVIDTIFDWIMKKFY